MEIIWKRRLEGGDRKFSECPERYKEKVLLLLQQDLEKGYLQKEEYDKILEQ